MANAARSTAPGAIPRGCYASYRGNLAGPPRKVEQNNRTFAAARMGVNMAAPDVASEEREKLTEWVNIIAFSEALMTKLLKGKTGEPIVVMGNVTLKFYSTGGGETRVDRTIVADSIMSASASVLPAREDSGSRRPCCYPARRRSSARWRTPSAGTEPASSTKAKSPRSRPSTTAAATAGARSRPRCTARSETHASAGCTAMQAPRSGRRSGEIAPP